MWNWNSRWSRKKAFCFVWWSQLWNQETEQKQLDGKKETEGFNLKAKKPRNGQNKRQKKSIISHKDNIIAAGDTDVHTAEEKQHKEA